MILLHRHLFLEVERQPQVSRWACSGLGQVNSYKAGRRREDSTQVYMIKTKINHLESIGRNERYWGTLLCSNWIRSSKTSEAWLIWRKKSNGKWGLFRVLFTLSTNTICFSWGLNWYDYKIRRSDTKTNWTFIECQLRFSSIQKLAQEIWTKTKQAFNL